MLVVFAEGLLQEFVVAFSVAFEFERLEEGVFLRSLVLSSVSSYEAARVLGLEGSH